MFRFEKFQTLKATTLNEGGITEIYGLLRFIAVYNGYYETFVKVFVDSKTRPQKPHIWRNPRKNQAGLFQMLRNITEYYGP